MVELERRVLFNTEIVVARRFIYLHLKIQTKILLYLININAFLLYIYY